MTHHLPSPAPSSGLLSTRRAFLQSSAAFIGALSLGSSLGAPAWGRDLRRYPIATPAETTVTQMLAFPATIEPGLAKTALHQVARYKDFGYGEWTLGSGLPIVTRTDLMRAGYEKPVGGESKRLIRFFAFTDVHITDKEAPNQLIGFQQTEPAAVNNTSIYSPVMPYTTQVLDAAVQTVNDLHSRDPFDFGIALGDACNSTSYNEVRWYIDVLDGQPITPSSGDHRGRDSVDFQMPFQAAGLAADLPWYQVLGNHDHFMIGSFPVDADPTIGLRQSYTADRIWAVGDVLKPNREGFPALFDYRGLKATPAYYPGVIDGASPYGAIIHTGRADDPAFAGKPPQIAADPGRRPLARAEWLAEFRNTTTRPKGHGFDLIDGAGDGFACYSFVPKSNLPLKVIVLDVTQSEQDGSRDIHGHGFLDARRWDWLKAELARGQADDQLMIIANHIPIGVSPIGSEMEWWLGDANAAPDFANAVDLAGLVTTLQAAPNLLMWIAGHRHLNVVKAFPSADPDRPEQGFWQVETCSLRDFPQQFRTFEIRLNADDTVSIEAMNVDIAVADGTPAAQSRKYAIATQQIIQNDLRPNSPNYATAGGKIPVPSMDPTRPQSDDPKATDPSIRFVDLRSADKPVQYHASSNVALLKQLSPRMVEVLERRVAMRK
ncbi:Twin-arginine translocation pathway signal [Rhodopseudomonas palustris HaA2]|uniref:Twin-arginine translocation pathway signal n=1 Tax=Rhodopseudomonas palustris (strain HaA2) TaxID=316058 RepID=Q2J205_RHOP2|nr:TIGR03768 family metallophosphoesterase [Rhodopseudomonas palustris]ABD05505.1 Twin-arginine translocation pathway signal [Rhodopseudomonas palustris HaA2]